jgi:hypothetical protein
MIVTAQRSVISQSKFNNHPERRSGMSTKCLFRWILISSMAVVILLLQVGIVPVRAECGEPPVSSCTTCHAQEDPINGKGAWHIIHASKDICINCHGGNASTMNKELAHDTLTANPLSDIYTDCHSCHPDYDARAQIFASILGITPGSCTTPTPFPAIQPFSGPQSGGINIPTSLFSTTSSLGTFLVIGSMFSIMVLFVFGLVLLERYHA